MVGGPLNVMVVSSSTMVVVAGLPVMLTVPGPPVLLIATVNVSLVSSRVSRLISMVNVVVVAAAARVAVPVRGATRSAALAWPAPPAAVAV